MLSNYWMVTLFLQIRTSESFWEKNQKTVFALHIFYGEGGTLKNTRNSLLYPCSVARFRKCRSSTAEKDIREKVLKLEQHLQGRWSHKVVTAKQVTSESYPVWRNIVQPPPDRNPNPDSDSNQTRSRLLPKSGGLFRGPWATFPPSW